MLSTLFANTVLPSQCAVCHRWPSQQLCDACLQRFAGQRPRCPRCALPRTTSDDGQPCCPQCRSQDWALQACYAAVDYDYPWIDLIRRYKFERQSGYSEMLAPLLLSRPEVAQRLARLTPEDWLLPMPLSAQRLAERGFNQAWELAQVLHRRSGCRARLHGRLLIRIRHTEAQTRLDREQRLANVRGAFLVEPLLVPAVQGRTLILVDDVMTSGASLHAAARVLEQAGAARIEALVIARTPP